MKYILMCIMVLLVCFVMGWLVTCLLKKKVKALQNKITGTILSFGIGVAILTGIMLGYLSAYYHEGEDAQKALNGNEFVQVIKINKGYYFDGPGEKSALIFYPGAKVATEAYAPLMMRIAEDGEDCFLIDMPFHFAMLGGNAAEDIIDEYSYDQWLMGGHSMGGVVAANYTCDHVDQIDGVILLASYATKKIDDSIMLLSIYGDCDGVLSKEVYEKNRVNWPVNTEELIIKGGNHAQYADYGPQKGDGQPKITREEQINTLGTFLVSHRTSLM